MNLKEALINAYENGYRVIDGVVYNPDGKVLTGTPDSHGYIMFAPTKEDKVFIHRLVAYQKYGNKIFEDDIQVRHLDNNYLNNFNDNIALGDQSRNMMDRPKEIRRRIAGDANRKHPHVEIIEYYNETRSYKRTMLKFGLTSKGTLNYILKKSMATE